MADLNNMTDEEMRAEIARLSAENATLTAKQAARQHFTLKVSEKGALSAYGLGRFPVSLYRSQWETVISHVEDIKAFIAANSDKLTTKGEPKA